MRLALHILRHYFDTVPVSLVNCSWQRHHRRETPGFSIVERLKNLYLAGIYGLTLSCDVYENRKLGEQLYTAVYIQICLTRRKLLSFNVSHRLLSSGNRFAMR
jgi:hypothetical protein